jgi:hypothetical protein
VGAQGMECSTARCGMGAQRHGQRGEPQRVKQRVGISVSCRSVDGGESIDGSVGPGRCASSPNALTRALAKIDRPSFYTVVMMCVAVDTRPPLIKTFVMVIPTMVGSRSNG